MEFNISSNFNHAEKIELPSTEDLEKVLKNIQQANKTDTQKIAEDDLLEIDISENNTVDDSTGSINAKRNKSNKYFTANDPPIETCNNDGFIISVGDETHRIKPSYHVETTPSEITEEEAANGVVKKERKDYTVGNKVPAPDSHSDIYTYQDGSQLINHYDDGKTLSGQTEITYSAGCNPENPKVGDTRTDIERRYNSDGSYYETITRYEYSEDAGWYTTAVYNTNDHKAYDADGNEVSHGSKEYWDIVRGDIERLYPWQAKALNIKFSAFWLQNI